MPAFSRPTPVRELAALVGGEVRGVEEMMIAGVAGLEQAGPGDLSFLGAKGYGPELARTGASAVLVDRSRPEAPAPGRTFILVDDSYVALQAILADRFPGATPTWGISPNVRIGKGVRWIDRLSVADGCHLGEGVTLGAGCVLGRNVTLGSGVVLGDECVLDDDVVVYEGVRLGNRVTVKAGACLGSPGFGFVSGPGGHTRINQVGGCVIEDDVEIGAHTTVDRGSVQDTVIGRGTKIDNLVQIAHNVEIGAHCIILAQAGIAGSTRVGDRVAIAGQAGLAGHLSVGPGARIAAQSGVIGDVAAGATVSGYPARNHRDVLRQAVALRRITARLSELEALAPSDDT